MAEPGKLDRVAIFRCGDDLRVMFVGEGARGEAILREDICGPSVVDAYGADAARLQVSIPDGRSEALARALREVFNAGCLREFAANEKNDILDLMDLCDREGLPYEFLSLDTEGLAAMRPSSE